MHHVIVDELKSSRRQIVIEYRRKITRYLHAATFSPSDEIETFAEDKEGESLTRASLRGGVRATSILAVTNFRVALPRLFILLPFFLSSRYHRGEFVLVLSRRRAVTICCERGGVKRTLCHKFPSCSKTNRVELIHFLPFWKRMNFCYALARTYALPK